jgi:hypothetical protein
MSSSRQKSLIATAQDPTTEVFLIDGDFNRIAKGVGTLKTRVDPGIYKVRFKAGSTMVEVDAFVEPDASEVHVNAPAMKIRAPAPLAETSTGHEYQFDASRRLSGETHETLGSGSGLYVFVRDIDRRGRSDPARGLYLCAADGEVIADMAESGSTSYGTDDAAEQAAWSATTLELEPGFYRLRVTTGEIGDLEMPVVASPEWQTQIFMLRRAYGDGSTGRRPDLTNASILMSRLERAYDPGREDLRWTELARQGLAEGRVLIPTRDLENMLWAKFENPMLGIFGAHFLLMADRLRRSVFDEVIGNLEDMLGDHPDVDALKLAGETRRRQTIDRIFEFPPIVKRGWRHIVEATSKYPDLVPVDSVAGSISDRIWGAGPWLVWNRPPESDAEPWEETMDPAGLESMLDRLGEQFPLDPSISYGPQLTSLEQGLISYAQRLTPQTQRGQRRTESLDVVQSLGVPKSVASKAAVNLAKKLNMDISG